MCGAEIEKCVLCCWVEGLVEFRRFCSEAIDGIRVRYTLGVGQVAPIGNDKSVAPVLAFCPHTLG